MASVQPGTPVFFPEAYKIVDGAVVGLFRSVGEITCRKLSHSPVIVDAVAANRLLAAGICTIAVLQVSLFITFHGKVFR
jgi:hypothetical protein